MIGVYGLIEKSERYYSQHFNAPKLRFIPYAKIFRLSFWKPIPQY